MKEVTKLTKCHCCNGYAEGAAKEINGQDYWLCYNCQCLLDMGLKTLGVK